MVTRDTGSTVGGGILAGVAIAAVLSRYTASLLYGVTPLDPASLTGGMAAMALLAILAASVPALTASRVDPATVFRDT